MNNYCKAGGPFITDSMNESKQLKKTLLRLESQTIAKNCAQTTHLTL